MRKKSFKNAQRMARSFLMETNVIESYNDLEADLENITNDFLHLVNEFNQIPTAYFELEPSSASH
ncbi:hypothetical protein HMPREF1398_01357 [Helicobacter pylori GAM117Ai]|nr:hypothetical protein HMPREF1398_01357 [Helicobacter pylori GAM117Ai]